MTHYTQGKVRFCTDRDRYVVIQDKKFDAANLFTVVPCVSLPKSQILGNAERLVECWNAMDGIESPTMLRSAYECVKHLELDKYYCLKEEHDALVSAVKAATKDVEFIEELIEAAGQMNDRLKAAFARLKLLKSSAR